MATSIRKPFQGVWNIIRFNWPYYVFVVCLVIILFIAQTSFQPLNKAIIILMFFILYQTLFSLVVSFYVYDLSDLYKLNWLNNLQQHAGETIININAGFDETSNLLKEKFRMARLLVADFYNPKTHTEPSIKRARKTYPSFPGTQRIATVHLPFQNNSADKIFTILSAHEIRNDTERIGFFKELQRILKPSGHVIVTEHLRDAANFFAYTIGFFHFHSKATWLKTFYASGFTVLNEIKITPFITTFVLIRNGIAP